MRPPPSRDQWPEFPRIAGFGEIPNYILVLADTMSEQRAQKKLLGKPKVAYGKLLAAGAYIFEIGGMLGERVGRDRPALLKAFWPVGNDQALIDVLADYSFGQTQDTSTIDFFPITHAAHVLKFEGSSQDLLEEMEGQSAPLEMAHWMLMEIACCAAAFAMVWPSRMREIYDRTYYPTPNQPVQPEFLSHEIASFDSEQASHVAPFENFVRSTHPGALP